MKTFVKWQGNKTRYLKHLLPHVPKDYNRYIEPFVGSGALLLNLNPKNWVISDINKDLINIYISVSSEPQAVIEYLERFVTDEFKSLTNKEKCYKLRQMTASIDCMPYETLRACSYLLLIHTVYMGTVINNRGVMYFNGLDLNITVNNRFHFLEENYKKNLVEVSQFLKKGCILNQDYKTTLGIADKGDFVFLDPPYVEPHDYRFKYNKDEVLDNDFLLGLLEQVKLLDLRGVKWMMTQADTPRVRQLFSTYTISEFSVYRHVTKTYKTELLIKNYETSG